MLTALKIGNCSTVKRMILRKKIIFIGDSITAGYGVERAQAFPAVIERTSDRWSCLNQGRSGWATTGYIHRLNYIVAEIPDEVDGCCLQLGANDLRLHGHTMTTVNQCVSNLAVILDAINYARPRASLILMSSPCMDVPAIGDWLHQEGFGAMTNEWLEVLRDEYCNLAQRMTIPFIDLFDVLLPGNTLDGAHPTIDGHRLLAKRIAGELEKIFVATY
jgi:acyl-CoA thioesterase I